MIQRIGSAPFTGQCRKAHEDASDGTPASSATVVMPAAPGGALHRLPAQQQHDQHDDDDDNDGSYADIHGRFLSRQVEGSREVPTMAARKQATGPGRE